VPVYGDGPDGDGVPDPIPDDDGVRGVVPDGEPGPVSPPGSLAPALGALPVPVPTPVLPLAGEVGPEAPTKPALGVLGLDPPPFDHVGDEVWPWDWPPLRKNRTASIPSANAPPANAIGCRRANASTSVMMSLEFR